jgi:RNA polymerase-binding transcription factor DksA
MKRSSSKKKCHVNPANESVQKSSNEKKSMLLPSVIDQQQALTQEIGQLISSLQILGDEELILQTRSLIAGFKKGDLKNFEDSKKKLCEIKMKLTSALENYVAFLSQEKKKMQKMAFNEVGLLLNHVLLKKKTECVDKLNSCLQKIDASTFGKCGLCEVNQIRESVKLAQKNLASSSLTLSQISSVEKVLELLEPKVDVAREDQNGAMCKG